MKKYFIMGKDKNSSYDATYINYFGKKHLFHIVDNDFPLPEAGIITLPFFRQYERYSIEYSRWWPDQEVFIENDPNIPAGIYLIKSYQLTVSYHNNDRNPALIKVPKYEPIQTIKETHRIILTQERTTIAHQVADLKNKTRLQHIEEKLVEILWCNVQRNWPLNCNNYLLPYVLNSM